MPNIDDQTSLIDPRSLIDTAAIAAADHARDATLRAHREAQAAVADAESALRAANVAADAAPTNGVDPLAAERLVSDRELTLRAAKRRLVTAKAAVDEAPHLHRQAVGQAHAGAVREVVRQTLQAHQTGAEAKALIAATERRMHALQAMVNEFHHVGAHGLRNAENRPALLRDVADEIKLFAANGLVFEEFTK